MEEALRQHDLPVHDTSDAERLAQNRGPTVLAVTAAMIILATIFVFFRFVSRIGIVRKVTWDDYFILLAWVRSSCTISTHT